MKLLKILVIDDEELIRWSFEKQFADKNYRVFTAASGEEGISIFEKQYPDIVFVDNKLPGMQGLDVILKIKALDEDATIVFMTAYGSINTAVQAMKNGAVEYINKPFSFDEIRLLIENIKNNLNITNEIKLIHRLNQDKLTFNDIIGESKAFRQIVRITEKIALSETSMILLLGESGTGKDLFARAIHNVSSRKDQPFVTINCATFPESLLESELFGHEKGAFTDAQKLKKGLFEIAEGGTVFLDEIGEINTNTQVKLLSVLENRTIKRVGGTTDIPVDIRIVAATNKDLEKSVENSEFRQDLYYRLKVFQVILPPLRDHSEDIPDLLNYYLNYFNIQFKKQIKGFSKEAEKKLVEYSWPGNVRELRNVMERAIILAISELIELDSLPQEIINESEKTKKKRQTDAFSLPDQGISLDGLEKEMIRQALEKAENNQTRAAQLLSISRDTLRYKKKKHGL